jgi:hypothetical protein
MTPHRGHPMHGSIAKVAILTALALGVAAAAPAARAQVSIEKVSPSFRPGPYAAIKVDPMDPERVVIATEDGHVIWSEDGGLLAHETVAISPRRMDAMALRGGARQGIAMRTKDTAKRATLLFLHNLRAGNPPVRHTFWMGLSDPITFLTDLALPPGPGPLLAAGPNGIFLSDADRTVWTRTLGGPGLMPRPADLTGISVGVDPYDPRRIIAGTSQGIMISRDGGHSFVPHPDPRSAADIALQIIFDPQQPGLVFAVTGDTVLVSDDGGESFAPGLAVDGQIRAMRLAPEAAYLATSDGLHVVLPDRVEHFMKGKDLLDAIGWGEGFALALTDKTLYLVGPDGSYRPVLRTSDADPYISITGVPGSVWLLSRYDVRRLRPPPLFEEQPRGGYRPPRLLVDQRQIEQIVLEHTRYGDPERTRLHERWYAKLVPRLVFQVNGWMWNEAEVMRDGTFPVRFRRASAEQGARTEWVALAIWDLSRFAFGDRTNVTNANLILESSLRENRSLMLQEVRWRARETAELVALMKEPPPDPRTELFWTMRLEEHVSYLEFLAGRQVVEMEPSQ